MAENTAPATTEESSISEFIDEAKEYMSTNWKCITASTLVGAAVGAAAMYFFLTSDDD